MFLFLSKLLPMFIYPLGLTCLLMAATLMMIRLRRRRLATVTISLALALLLIASNPWVAVNLVKSLEWQYLPNGELPKAAAIVVLGGGIKPAIPPRPWVDFADAGDRIIYGVQLYRQGKAPFLILSGGRVNWKGGGPPESQDMAAIAEFFGVPASAILQDSTSFNTYQNAVNVKQILDTQGIKGPVLLVTSAFHTPRSMMVFKRQGMDVIAAPTDFWVTKQELKELKESPQSFLLNLLPDVGKLGYVSLALKEYIGIWVYRLKGWL